MIIKSWHLWGGRANSFAITDTKLCVPVVILSTEDNAKLLQQLYSGFDRTIIWYKYLPKVTTPTKKHCFDWLMDPSLLEVNALIILPFDNATDRTLHTEYNTLNAEIDGYIQSYDGWKNVFDQAVRNETKNMFSNSKNYKWSRRWLHNYFSARLSLYQRTLQDYLFIYLLFKSWQT